MKTRIAIALCIMLMGLGTTAVAGEKQDAKIAYVIKNAKLSKEVSAKLKPLLNQYYTEMSAAKASHKALKDKLSGKEDAGKLSAAECDQLMESKMKQETAQLAVKKKFYTSFKGIMPAQQAYKVIKLCDDKVK